MCEKLSNVILTRNGNHVINGLVITIYTKGIKNRALTNTGSGASYASSILIDEVDKRTNQKKIEAHRNNNELCS